MEKEEKTVMHVRVDMPLHLRKSVLKSAIDSAKILKDYEIYKELRDKKLERFRELHSIMKNVEKLFREFKDKDLPIVKEIEDEERKKEREEERLARKEKLTEEKPREVFKVKKPKKSVIDDEIEDIKSRLKDLEL